jgi:hypothetical protein
VNKKMSNSPGFFERPVARGAAIFVVIAAVAMAGWTLWNTFRPSDSLAAAENPLFIDAENGKTFNVKLEAGMQIPVTSPFTGKQTGYKAELCYWTKDGQPKSEPTAVLMNFDIGKSGPTFCPDCGRLVVFHNPVARPGMRPPPTESEYLARQNRTASGN